jgi:hypothetical protein
MNSEDQLLQKLVIAKKIMEKHNDINRGAVQESPTINTPSLQEFQPVNGNYNIPSEFLGEDVKMTQQHTEIPTQDRIMGSRLPDEIKRLMIEHPIQKPESYNPTLSNDIIEKAAKLMNNNKNNVGSYFALGGSQSELAGYYIHIQPKNCFVGGGIYMPQPNVLKKIRQEIDYNSEEFLEIINETNFQKYFGTIQGEKLKNTPKDYEKTHPMSEYLKLKGFFVVANFTDEQICNNDFVEQMAVRFETM